MVQPDVETACQELRQGDLATMLSRTLPRIPSISSFISHAAIPVYAQLRYVFLCRKKPTNRLIMFSLFFSLD